MNHHDPDRLTLKVSSIPRTEFNETFLQGMLNRMGVSYHKYGKVKDAFPGAVDALGSLRQRLEKYVETKNTEYLIDAANFAMIEFMHPSLAGAFFEATDSAGSPGRTTNKGRTTSKHNLDIEDAPKDNPTSDSSSGQA